MKLLLLLLPLTWSETMSAAESGPELIRVCVKEGDDVVLPCSLNNTNMEALLFDWKKDRHKEVFLYNAGPLYAWGRLGQDEQFKGRVSHFPAELKHGNASILITNTKVADSGNYSCDFPRLEPGRQIFLIQLLVGVSPKPYVSTLDQTKDWSLLQCEIQGAFPRPSVVWQDGAGNLLPPKDPEVTERDGRLFIILQTTVTKSGRYRCVATQEELNHQVYTETYVHLSASEPSVTILRETKDWALLQCVVRGASPRPSLVWKDGAGHLVPSEEAEVTERGGSYHTVLHATVTRSDRYQCEATQDDIQHHAHIYVHIHVSEFPIGWMAAAAVLGAFLVLVVHVVLRHKGYISCNKGSHTATSQSLNSLPDQPLKEVLTE